MRYCTLSRMGFTPLNARRSKRDMDRAAAWGPSPRAARGLKLGNPFLLLAFEGNQEKTHCSVWKKVGGTVRPCWFAASSLPTEREVRHLPSPPCRFFAGRKGTQRKTQSNEVKGKPKTEKVTLTAATNPRQLDWDPRLCSFVGPQKPALIPCDNTPDLKL